MALQKHVIGPRAGALAVIDYARADAVLLGAAIGGGRGETASNRALRVLFDDPVAGYGTLLAGSPEVTHPRYREYVPAMPAADARRLRGLPAAWEDPIVESAVDGLERRARALASSLTERGRKREADELRRLVALLERVDDLHRHAGNLETLAGLYRALAMFADERDPADDGSVVWAQTGALGDGESSVGHGPAFRETAALRNRAYRRVASSIARHAQTVQRATDLPPRGR